MKTFRLKTGLMAAAACALALGAAGCRDDDAGQRIAVPDPTPAELLPTMLALPFAEAAPVRWAGADAGYRWAERAYGLEQAFYDAPPDYAFDYGGVQPWVWETADDWAMYAEPWDDGYRYYYYEPGAAYPYFVRDGLYGYGFDPTGILVALFDDDGDYLPAERFYEAAPLAGRYYLHGRDLRNAAVQAPHIVVQEDVWVQRAPAVRAASEPWLQAARRDPRWRTWRDRTGERELARFVQEDRRRERQALAAQQVARFDAPREVLARRDLAQAQRDELRAQRDHARAQAHQQARFQGEPARRAQAEQRRAEREVAQRLQAERRAEQRAQAEQRRAQREQQAFAQRAEAERRRAERDQARAAEAHARQAAAQARAAEDRGPKPDRGGGPERQGKPEQPQRQDHGGGPKPDHGGGKPDHGGGEGKGGGKKN